MDWFWDYRTILEALGSTHQDVRNLLEDEMKVRIERETIRGWYSRSRIPEDALRAALVLLYRRGLDLAEFLVDGNGRSLKAARLEGINNG